MYEERMHRLNGKIALYGWQLDVAERLLLGVNCELIAPTGAGNAIPFALPLFYLKNKILIIVPLLHMLEADQLS
jgi:hypothetical protein